LTRLSDLPIDAVAGALRGEGLSLDFGAARARIRTDVPALASAIHRVYGEFSPGEGAAFHDVTVSIARRRGPRRLLRPQIEMFADAIAPFEPFPADTHLPLLEWGINYLLADRLNHRLLLHAGVVERDGQAIVMPALPGSGKSTLTAALAMSGFRLLSDEFGVVSLDDGTLWPLLRPIALKNASIDVIASFAPGARMGPRFPRTRKGTVAHLAPDAKSYLDRTAAAQPSLVVFPRYVAGSGLTLDPVPKAKAFAKLSVNSFNYPILGPDAFDAVCRLLRGSSCYRLTYGDLGQAIEAIRELVAGRTAGARR
jgi:HprK-related kinase A